MALSDNGSAIFLCVKTNGDAHIYIVYKVSPLNYYSVYIISVSTSVSRSASGTVSG